MPSPRSLFVLLLILFSLSGLGVASEYDRGLFPHWQDFDKDGIDAREEALVTQALTVVLVERVKDDIRITGGIWICPYTGKKFTNPSNMDADHIVPLKWAWDHGADKWSEQTRESFANDPDNIIVVSASANRSKGANGPTEWVPPTLAYIHEYVSRFILVCEKYNLVYNKEKYLEVVHFFNPYRNGIHLDRTNFDKED